MKDLTIVIPFRPSTEERQAIFDWVHAKYGYMFPDSEIIVADSSASNPFNRSQARNNGMDEVRTKYVLLSDADTLGIKPYIEGAIEAINDDSPWVIPFDVGGLYILNQEYSLELMSKGPDVEFTKEELKPKNRPPAIGGLSCMKTESFHRVNGYDERFLGWGYEDNAFQLAMDAVVGSYKRLANSWAIHLYHDAPRTITNQQPNFGHNYGHIQNYKRAEGNKGSMLRVVSGNRV